MLCSVWHIKPGTSCSCWKKRSSVSYKKCRMPWLHMSHQIRRPKCWSSKRKLFRFGAPIGYTTAPRWGFSSPCWYHTASNTYRVRGPRIVNITTRAFECRMECNEDYVGLTNAVRSTLFMIQDDLMLGDEQSDADWNAIVRRERKRHRTKTLFDVLIF